MVFREFGDKRNKAIVMLHGGGLSWWSLKPVVDMLKDRYYCIVSTIDGHGDDDNTFSTIGSSANSVVEYIENQLDGKIYAIYGLSIGAQITVEVLSRDSDIAEYAIIESGLVYPMKYMVSIVKPMYAMSYGLIKKKWFSKYQAKSLFVPEDMMDTYYEDSCKISKETLINMTISNSTYSVPATLHKSNAKALVMVGGKELGIMKKSVNAICDAMPNSTLMVLKGNGHGQISLQTPQEFVEIVTNFLGR